MFSCETPQALCVRNDTHENMFRSQKHPPRLTPDGDPRIESHDPHLPSVSNDRLLDLLYV